MIPIETENIPNINSMLSGEEKILRSFVINKLIELKQPVSPNELAKKEDQLNFDLKATRQSLTDKGLISTNDAGAITGAYPVSAMPTSHKIELKDGRSFHAMCAIDSLGTTFEFNQDITISSSCTHCNQSISVSIENGEISTITPPTIHALHVDLEKYKDWATTC